MFRQVVAAGTAPPVTLSFCEVADTNGPASPMFNGSRVSKMRTGSTPPGCAAIAGDWYSVYGGLTWADPAELEIDHVVALKEAWDSGAWGWTPERRSAFGNDLDDPRSCRTSATERDLTSDTTRRRHRD